MQIVLARNALFALCVSVILALMAVIGLKVSYLSAVPKRVSKCHPQKYKFDNGASFL